MLPRRFVRREFHRDEDGAGIVASKKSRLLVAAGVILRRHQHQTWPSHSWFRLSGTAKRGENAKNDSVGGKNSEADTGQHCGEDNDGHEERNHG